MAFGLSKSNLQPDPVLLHRPESRQSRQRGTSGGAAYAGRSGTVDARGIVHTARRTLDCGTRNACRQPLATHDAGGNSSPD